MAVLKNRAGVSTSTAGAGPITLGTALAANVTMISAAWQTFANAGVVNGDVVRYLVLDNNGAWEYGPGTYTAGSLQLSRAVGAMDGTVPGQKSSTGSLLTLSGNAQVFVVAVAEDILPDAPSDGDYYARRNNIWTGLSDVFMRWIPYIGPPQSFLKQDMTRDGGWTMVANKNTSDRPAPQPTGAEINLLPAAFLPNEQNVRASYTVANEWTLSSGGWVNQYGVDVSAQNVGALHAMALLVNGQTKDSITITPNVAGMHWQSITPLLVPIGSVVRVAVQVTQVSNNLMYWDEQVGLFATAPTYCSLAQGQKDGGAKGNTAYDCHCMFTPGSPSADWDVVAYGGATATGGGTQAAELTPGHGRFEYVSTTSCRFIPYIGNRIKLNGKLYQIPAAGISMANTNVFVNGAAGQNLGVGQTYLVSLFDNAGALTPHFSSNISLTRDTTPGNVGVVYPTGYATHILIGMVQMSNPGANFQNTPANRGVISWFNRRNIVAAGANTNGVQTTSSTLLDLGAAYRAYFCNWADESVFVAVEGSVLSTAAGTPGASVGVDGPTGLLPQVVNHTIGNATWWGGVGGAGNAGALADGSHYVVPLGMGNGVAMNFYLSASAIIRG